MSEVLVVPNPVLRQVAKPIRSVSPKLISLITDMIATLKAAQDPEGVGLAAPQVGVALRLFIMIPSRRSQPQVFINPEIITFSKATQKGTSKNGVYEGCLSIPHHYSPITRSLSVTVKYQTLSNFAGGAVLPSKPRAGNRRGVDPSTDLRQDEPKLITKTESFTGLPAHIIQHEVDHLNGILFVDRVLEQEAKIFNIQGKKWEEITI